MPCSPGLPLQPRQRPVAAVLVALAALWAVACPARADDGAWQLQVSDAASGIEIYLSPRGDEPPAFRGVMQLQARVSALTAVLLDTQRMPEWVYRTRRVLPLAQQGPFRGVSQVITAMPWPLLDREAIVAWELSQDGQGGAVTLSGRNAPQGLPPSAGLLRMPRFESQWRFTPVAAGRVEVVFEGHGDPGGSLASPLLRGFVAAAVWEAPLRTLQGLQRMVVQPIYRDARLPFITEPP